MKKIKTLWRFSVITTLEAEDAVAELLGNTLGQHTSAHFNVETRVSIVSVFCPHEIISSTAARAKILAGLKQVKNCGLKIGPGKIKINKVRREDWAESWKRHFKAIEIGDALLIKPSWIQRRPRKNQAVVILDPGLSFGTGQHATTSFCLHQMVAAAGKRPKRRLPGNATKSFLDIGTGSGILAIAAAKLGFRPVRAFDFDPEAVRVARGNARINGVSRKIKIVREDVIQLSKHPARSFDLVCANLISNLLIAEREKIAAQLKHGGTLVLAGILKTEFVQVQNAFAGLGLKLIAAKSEKEWRSGAFQFAT